ncbi:MAG: tRNA pseudouridine(55) synthase TruB [Candidatus Cloacimonetes bacterium]|nr:tRNA pseudouridine(55) synthase TruB [Candidatus Cloacimonadota bacterium]MCF7813500.1 tRNA pseudouridine(55) synthase TruB [Candidatus Cloacimonadota bacterium]MCF7868577.1 tRNA pseudouridine(55) synthase TruB [Candidatus Cloacimonadota bacterium]MCF7883364.1 tRNA pseudouridine(55) synthase TruB [Candidatus Cloacimonadota bacterium]
MNPFGVLLIDKPVGLSSFDIIRKIRKITDIRKVGHTGTLDPFATGLLPVCIGKATRLTNRMMAKEKEYLVTMKLGVRTATGDTESEEIEELQIPEISDNDLIELKSKVEKIESQIPHKFSAIRIDGKRAYQLARKNEDFTIQARPIQINDFSIESFDLPIMKYRVIVSKGTYIRTLSETIAEMLGTIGTTLELRRTKIGNLKIENAVKIKDLNSENWQQNMISVPDIFPDIESIIIENIEHYKNGRFIDLEHENCDDVMVLSPEQDFLGFAKIHANMLQPKTVFI